MKKIFMLILAALLITGCSEEVSNSKSKADLETVFKNQEELENYSMKFTLTNLEENKVSYSATMQFENLENNYSMIVNGVEEGVEFAMEIYSKEVEGIVTTYTKIPGMGDQFFKSETNVDDVSGSTGWESSINENLQDYYDLEKISSEDGVDEYKLYISEFVAPSTDPEETDETLLEEQEIIIKVKDDVIIEMTVVYEEEEVEYRLDMEFYDQNKTKIQVPAEAMNASSMEDMFNGMLDFDFETE